MADIAKRDQNNVPTLLGASSVDQTPVTIYANPTTHRLLVDNSGTGGDVVGPASSTDNAIVRFDGTTGKLIQNSLVTIDDTGHILAIDGTAALPSYSFASQPSLGIYSAGTNSLSFATAGVIRFNMSGSQFSGAGGQLLDMPSAGSMTIQSAGTNQNVVITPSGTGRITSTKSSEFASYYLNFSNSTGMIASGNNVLLNFTATTGAFLRVQDANSNAVATFNVAGNSLFGTTTDSSNGRIQLASGTTSAAGIGFGTDTTFYRSAAGRMDVSGQNTMILRLLSSGGGAAQMTFDNTTWDFDTRATGGMTFRTNTGTLALTLDASQNAAFAHNVAVGTGDYISWPNRATIKTPSDGVLTLQNGAQTDFTRLQFGGTTSSFPSLKRSGTSLQVKLADDSTYAPLTTGNLDVNGPITTTPQGLSGAGAVNLTTLTTAYTSSGVAQALTLADGSAGQIKTIIHAVDGGSGVLTPTTPLGYSTITFTNAGDSVTLQWVTQGWAVIGSRGVVIA